MTDEIATSLTKAAAIAGSSDAKTVRSAVNGTLHDGKGNAWVGVALGKAAPDTMQRAADNSADATVSMVQGAADAESRMMNGFAQALTGMGLPSMFDFATLAAVHRRNIEAVSAASCVSLQGAESAVRREMEIVQRTIKELSEAALVLLSAETPLEWAAHYAKLSKMTYEGTVTSIREMSDLIRNSNREAFDLLSQHALNTMTESNEAPERNG